MAYAMAAAAALEFHTSSDPPRSECLLLAEANLGSARVAAQELMEAAVAAGRRAPARDRSDVYVALQVGGAAGQGLWGPVPGWWRGLQLAAAG